ncbi:MAG: hypothetical protein ACREOM_01730 [Candidatus Dormibacteraceae bacterium]
MSGRRVWVLFGALALLGSQAGHLLAYEVRFGAAAQQLQASGSHAYFPTLAKTGLGALAAVSIGGLFMVGLARIASGRPLARDRAAPPYLRLVAAMFTIQLAVFVGQELTEGAVAGLAQAPVLALLFWGTLGQLPVALIGALALRWLLLRMRAAVTEINAAFAPARPEIHVVAAVTNAGGEHGQLVVGSVAETSPAKRGPPSSLRLSSS